MYPNFGMLCVDRSTLDESEVNNLRNTISPVGDFDCELSWQSKQRNYALKNNPMIGQFDLIVVSPLRRALQTVFEIFGQQASVKIVIEPLLAPQLNNASSMGATSNCKILSECKATVDDSIITESLKPWYVSFMSEEHKTELSKRRYTHQSIYSICLSMIKTKYLENISEFSNRIAKLKQSLLLLNSQSKKKMLLVTHQDVLAFLTATSLHQDYSTVNSVPFDFGYLKNEYVLIEGAVGEKHAVTTYCSCS